jgi:hypothetical protein
LFPAAESFSAPHQVGESWRWKSFRIGKARSWEKFLGKSTRNGSKESRGSNLSFDGMGKAISPEEARRRRLSPKERYLGKALLFRS